MKAIVFTAIAFAAMSAVAVAQDSPTPPQPAAAAKSDDQLQPSPPPPPPETAGGPDAMWQHDRAGPPHGDRGRHWPPPPPPPSKAAHFRIESRDTKIDVKCADDEPSKVCADTVLEIINKLNRGYDRSDDYRN